MSFTDLCTNLWEHKKAPVAALATQHGIRMVQGKIPEPHGAVFSAAAEQLVGWYPKRREPLAEIWEQAIMEPSRLAAEALTGHALTAGETALEGLEVLVANLDRHARAKRTLPREIDAIGAEQLEAFFRKAIRVNGHTQIRDVTRRLSLLLDLAGDKPWPTLVDAAAAMGWTTLEPGLRTLPPRLRDLAEAIDCGGVADFTRVGDRAALRITLVDGTRRMGVLSPEEDAELRAVVPWIPRPPE